MTYEKDFILLNTPHPGHLHFVFVCKIGQLSAPIMT